MRPRYRGESSLAHLPGRHHAAEAERGDGAHRQVGRQVHKALRAGVAADVHPAAALAAIHRACNVATGTQQIISGASATACTNSG